MSSPLFFLRPLRYDRVRDVLLVQTDAASTLPAIVVKLREIFPGCKIQALVREADGAFARSLDVEQLEVARWEDRYELLTRLRRRRFDVAAMQLAGHASNELRMLPFLVRTRSLVAFNDSIDYFPLNVFRLTTVAHHFSLLDGEASTGRALFWLVRRSVVAAVAGVVGFVVLLASVGMIHLRGWWRRLRRARGTRTAGAGVRLG